MPEENTETKITRNITLEPDQFEKLKELGGTYPDGIRLLLSWYASYKDRLPYSRLIVTCTFVGVDMNITDEQYTYKDEWSWETKEKFIRTVSAKARGMQGCRYILYTVVDTLQRSKKVASEWMAAPPFDPSLVPTV